MIYCPKCGDETAICTSNKDGRKYHVCVNYPRCQGRVSLKQTVRDQGWGDDWDAERPATHNTHDRPHQQRYTERASSQHRDMDMEDIVVDRQGSAGRGLKLGPTCLGALVAIALQLLVVLLVQTADPDMSHTPYFVIIAVTTVVSYFGGGFLAGAMTRGKGISHGILSGFIAWAMCLILAQIMWSFFGGGYDYSYGYSSVIWGYPVDKTYFFIVYLLVGLLAALGFGSLGGFSGAKFREHWK